MKARQARKIQYAYGPRHTWKQIYTALLTRWHRMRLANGKRAGSDKTANLRALASCLYEH